MKVKIDLDMTPEEARTLMGLPDLQPMQERLLAQLEKQLASNMTYVDPEQVMKGIMPMGAQSMEQFQELLWGMARSAMGSGGKNAKDKTNNDKDQKGE